MEWQLWNMWDLGAWNFARYIENPALVGLLVCVLIAALFFPVFGDRLFRKGR